MSSPHMNAIIATGYGGPEVFELKQVERPQPAAQEMLVAVQYSSATRADTMMRTGKPYIGRLFTGLKKPKHPIPGTGFAGTVVAVGSEVSRFAVGDQVFGETTLGFSTTAEYVSVPENGVILPLPSTLGMAEAAAFCDGPLTSYNFLKGIAQLQAGQRVLINGASGSLGMAAVQLAKHFGAEVTAVCSGRNVGLVRSLGVDHVIDYQQEDVTQSNRQFDLVYDAVGTLTFSACRSILTAEGLYLSPVLKFSLLWDMLRTGLLGGQRAKFEATGTKSDEALREQLAALVEIYRAGKLQVHIDRQFPLAQLSKAHTYIDSGRKKGNVVIAVG